MNLMLLFTATKLACYGDQFHFLVNEREKVNSEAGVDDAANINLFLCQNFLDNATLTGLMKVVGKERLERARDKE